MANKYQKQKYRFDEYGSSASLAILEDIKKLVDVERAKTKLNYDEFFISLKRWWCQHYKRPYKDPLLDSYTLEELYYEYCDVNFTTQAAIEETKPAEIPEEEWDWAAEEEAREIAEMEAASKAQQGDAGNENDTIVPALSDDDWASKYETKVNPTAEESNSGGDISANFENM